MKRLRHLGQYFVLLSLMVHGLWACAGIGIPNSTPTPTALAVLPLDQPGIVNADTVPVRKGPGAEFELAVQINRGYSIDLVGQSEDGTWYKVEIPGYTGDQSSLWIAADFVTVVSSTETPSLTPAVFDPSPTATETGTVEGTGPSPTGTTASATSPAATLAIATSQPSSTQCSVPAGWSSYVSQPGDTLFRLAMETNTTVDQLMQANCLTSDRIVAGTRIYLPFVPPTDTLVPEDTPLPTTSTTPEPSDTPFLEDTPTGTSTTIVTQQSPLGTQGTQSP